MDNDVAGIIAAACFLFVFIVIFVAFIACNCQRKMERRKRRTKTITTRASSVHSSRHLPVFATDSRSAISESDAASISPTRTATNGPTKIGDYKPKILSEEQKVSHNPEGTPERELKQGRYIKHKQQISETSSDIRQTQLNGRAVSVLYVNAREDYNYGWKRGKENNKTQYREGLVHIPYIHSIAKRNNGDVEGHDIVQRSSQYSTNSYSVQHKGGVILGQDMTSGGNGIIRGQVIKQHVVVGQDGKLVVASSEEKNVGDMSQQQQQANTILASSGGGLVRGHIIKQNVEVGDRGSFVVTSTEQRELSSNTRQRPASYTEQDIHHHYQNQDDEEEDEYHVTSEERHDLHGLLITEDRHVNWPFTPEEPKFTHPSSDVPDIVVTEESRSEPSEHSTTRPSSIFDMGGDDDAGEMPGMGDDDDAGEEENIGESRRGVSEFYSDKSKLKVIKKHSTNKPPDWLVQTYAEEAAHSDGEWERRESATQVDTSLFVTSSSSYVEEQRTTHKVTFSDESTEIQTAPIVTEYNDDNDNYSDDADEEDDTVADDWYTRQQIALRSAHLSGHDDHPDDGERYTVSEYEDPSGRVKALTQTYENIERTGSGSRSAYFVKTSVTARGMAMRQQINKSAERIPPALTSTPRSPWQQIQQSETTYMVTGELGTEHHRQRSADMSDPPEPPLLL